MIAVNRQKSNVVDALLENSDIDINLQQKVAITFLLLNILIHFNLIIRLLA